MTRINVNKTLSFISFFAAMILSFMGEYPQATFVIGLAIYFDIQSVKP